MSNSLIGPYYVRNIFIVGCPTFSLVFHIISTQKTQLNRKGKIPFELCMLGLKIVEIAEMFRLSPFILHDKR